MMGSLVVKVPLSEEYSSAKKQSITIALGYTVVLEVWPESHWPGFALRQTDVL